MRRALLTKDELMHIYENKIRELKFHQQLFYLQRNIEIEIQIIIKKRPGKILLLNFDLMFFVINVR